MKSFCLSLLLAGGSIALNLSGCTKPGPSVSAASAVAYYTCTMHPSVRSQDLDGKCPICGMELVPVKKPENPAPSGGALSSTSATPDQPHEFTIPLDRQQMIGVTFATAEFKPLRRTVRAAGTVATTTARHWDYVARVEGYVHDLAVAGPGDPVKKGQVLMDLYSPDLMATEGEYVDLLRMRARGQSEQNAATISNAERLLGGARARLQQWNISAAQIDAIEQAGQAEPFLALTSPFDGVVEEVAVHQGRHVAVGDHLIDIADLSSVWVWAEFYENELPLLKPGLAVTLSSSALPGLALAGQIAVVDPFINETKRTGRARIDVANAAGQLRPGAYVDVTLTLEAGRGLTVPVDAVLPTGEHAVVFVDRGSGRLEPRYVQLGGKFGDDFEITAGLRAGERVVSSANFLVDAESKVQGALKSW
jgi:membrane fusion protein, copper/silver efflux system